VTAGAASRWGSVAGTVLGLAGLGGVGLLVPADVRWPVIAAALVALAVASVAFLAGRRERAERRWLRLLLDSSEELMAPTDVRLALRQMARRIVPELADVCIVDFLRADGTFDRVAAVRDDNGSIAATVEQLVPVLDDRTHPSVRVVTSGEPELIRAVDDDLVRAVFHEADDPAVTGALGLASALVVPVTGHDDALGAVTLCFTRRSGRRYDEYDVAVARELGRRAGLAVELARANEAEHRFAADVQRSLLPRRLPTIPRVEVAARYAPADAFSAVGGDWYAVVPLGAHRIGLAIGDVSGHGLEAAAAMAEIRFALRAFAIESENPSDVLERLNQLMFHFGSAESRIVTALYGVLDVVGGIWTHAVAGHLPPLLAGPGGRPELLRAEPDLPLGTSRTARYTDRTFGVCDGSVLVLYTDGLVERRHQAIDEGIGRARKVLAEWAPVGRLDDLCDELVALAPVDAEDDLAIVAARVLPDPASDAGVPPSEP
jgi:serine phosphatase RsbU (regulator of sigma subunit)